MVGDPFGALILKPRSVERLVEGGCVRKHIIHILHFGHVPFVERLVERICERKHPYHILHVGNVPIIERLVKG